MKVLVCGSRSWKDYTTIILRLKELPKDTIIIEGEAKGADRLAREAAEALGFKVLPFPANWTKYGKGAGFKRNIEMLNEEPDLVIAFQRNKSKGTQHTIDTARLRGISVEVRLEP